MNSMGEEWRKWNMCECMHKRQLTRKIRKKNKFRGTKKETKCFNFICFFFFASDFSN